MSCTRNGCGQLYTSNEAELCNFHPGKPNFHEGLKSWDCCSTISKPVTTFDEFLAIKGCSTGSHSLEKPEVVAPAPTPVVPSYFDENGKEFFGTAPPPKPSTSQLPPLPAAPISSIQIGSKSTPAEGIMKVNGVENKIEIDDPLGVLTKGMRCKRRGCEVDYDGDLARRESENCFFHPGAAEFREGSKGYFCCKRRVLDFDDFLGIKGCTEAKHLFIGEKKIIDYEAAEVPVECRSDHYQSPRKVHISIFGKGANKETSSVTFTVDSMTVDLHLPGHKRFLKTFALFAPIDPAESTFKVLGTKVEIDLAKGDARSWPVFQALSEEVMRNNFISQLAFSSGGGTGTTGAKLNETVLDGQNGGVGSI